MNKFKNQLEINNFKEVATLKGDFKLQQGNTDKNKQPSVYVWVARKEDLHYPVYIGKAGSGAINRFQQHLQGFKGPLKNGSVSGEKKKKVIEYLFAQGYTLIIFERISANTNPVILEALGLDVNLRSGISFNSTEEEIFIEAFKDFGFNKNLIMNDFVDVENVKSCLKSTELKRNDKEEIDPLRLLDLIINSSDLKFTKVNWNDQNRYKAELHEFQIHIRQLTSGVGIELRGPLDAIKAIKAVEGGSDREDSVFYPWSMDFAKSLNVSLYRINELKSIVEDYKER